MLDIVVCDDSPIQLETICKRVNCYFSTYKDIAYQVSGYSSPDELILDLKNGNGCDIVILDVIMPGSTGIETAKRIKELRKDAMIIFVSISREYAIDAYDIGAVHYVSKPLTQQALNKALDRALSLRKRIMNKRIMLSLKNAAMKSIFCIDILFIESVGYRRMVHTKKGVYEETRKTLAR